MRSNEASAVAEQLCSAELQAQDWRRRCFQAEAQLRLERLKRRGEQHPRWPVNAMQQQTLLGKHASLQASDIVGSTKEVLWDLVHAKTCLGQLEEELEQSSQEVQKLQKEAVQKREDASNLTEGRAAEDAAFAQRELEMNMAKDRARELARLLQESFAMENELAEKVALGQDAMELVHRQVQAFLPGQQKVQEEAQKALQEADRFRVLAQRRREAVTKTEEEVDQVEKSGQEENEALQLRLEQTRDELSEMVAKTAEFGDQARKAQANHSKQIKAVKEGGSALRDALSEVGQEKEDLQFELQRLRDIVESASLAHEDRQSRARAQEAVNEALEKELQMAHDSLQLAEVAHTEATGSRSGTVKAGLLKSKETLSKAQEAAQQAAQEAQEALQQLESLRSEKTRLTGETGVEAERRRAQTKEALRKEVIQLKVELETTEAACQGVRDKLEWHRHLREAQQFARCAAKEAASTIRGVYGDLSRGKSAKSSDAATAQKAARRLSKHLDDFLRFLGEAVALAEEKNVVPKTATSINLNLPSALKEAYVGKLAQNEDGNGLLQQLEATKEKLKSVRSELQEAQQGHQKDTESLREDCEDLRKRIEEGEEEGKAEEKKTEEAQERLSESITEAGCQRNEAQLQAVARVQKELGNHEREMALLRQERESLQGKLAAAANNSIPSSPGGMSPVANRLKMKEAELQEARKRLAQSEERFVHLVADGKPQAEELGKMRHARTEILPRPLARPAQGLSGLVRSAKSAAFRGSEDAKGAGADNKSAEEGREADVAPVAAASTPLPTPGGNAGGSTRSLVVPSPCTSQHGPSISEVEVATVATVATMESPMPVVETPSPRVLDVPPKITKEGSEGAVTGSSQPVSTPTAEVEAAEAEPTPKSGRSGFELASPSQLPQTLAEARQRDLEETLPPGPASPVFAMPEELPESEVSQTPAETPLRLEPAPCAQGSEVRTVSQVSQDEVVPSPASEPAPPTGAPESPPPRTPSRRSLVPALAMSWADMEAAALDPTPKCSDAVSPSYPSEPVETVSHSKASSPVHDVRAVRVEPKRPTVEAAAPQWEPVAVPMRQRSPSPVYCFHRASPPLSPRVSPSPLNWMPCQAPRAILPSATLVMPRLVQPLPQPLPMRPMRPLQVIQQVPAATAPIAVTMAAPPPQPQTPQPESQQSSNRSTPLPLYRLSCGQGSQGSASRSPSPEAATAAAPNAIRWGIIGAEASRSIQAQHEMEHVWVDDPSLSVRDSSYMTGSPVSESLRRSMASPSDVSSQASPEPTPQQSFPFRRPQDVQCKSHPAPKQPAVQDADFGSPEWASRALEGQGLLLPEPQLPPLQDLFAQNMLEQNQQRKLQKQQQREQREQRERMSRNPASEETSETLPDGFFKSIVKL